MTYCIPGQPFACTGSPDSIISALRARGFENPMLKVGMRTHNVELLIEPHEDGWKAANLLRELLPAGVQTIGEEVYCMPGLWGPGGDIRLSRNATECPDPEECMDFLRVGNLLGHSEDFVREVLVGPHASDQMRTCPCKNGIPYRNFHNFLVAQGCYQGPCWNPSPDPYAYYLRHVQRGS